MCKNNTLVISLFIILFMIAFSQSRLNAQAGIEFTFANPVISNVAGVYYLDFDIMAQATANSQFKIAQIYINYNTAAFGTNLFTNGNVSITAGSPLLDQKIDGTIPTAFGVGTYTTSVVDNSTAILTIQNDFEYSIVGPYTGKGYELSNTLGITPQVYIHVKMRILDIGQTSGISFNKSISQWDQQDYYFTTPFSDTQALYSPVIENSTLDIPLPVELTSFTAKALGSEVQLNWETKTEINNYGFDVERASSLSNQEKIWEKIGFVNGNGNSNSPKHYSFADKNPTGGNVFVYRLKQIDTDGKYDYSNEIEVELLPSKYELYQNYPNPFNPTTTIKFSLPEASQVSIKIFDILGRFVEEIANASYEAGYHKVEFNASSYPSGVYLYRIENINFSSIKKMLLIK